MSQFRKKPVVIDAVQLTEAMMHAHILDAEPLPDGVILSHADYHRTRRTVSRCGFFIRTLGGRMEVSPGDWVITGIKGEIYPCKPDIFAATYDAVEVSPENAEVSPNALPPADAVAAQDDSFSGEDQ